MSLYSYSFLFFIVELNSFNDVQSFLSSLFFIFFDFLFHLLSLEGVGDGPWDTMEDYDDNLPERKFDNFQFVNFAREIGKGDVHGETNFALACLQV